MNGQKSLNGIFRRKFYLDDEDLQPRAYKFDRRQIKKSKRISMPLN